MILLGLILLVLGVALGLVAYLAATPSTQTIELTEFGFTRASGPLELLIIGAVAMLLVWLGWSAMSVTMRRRARLRREEREQERYAELERTHEEYRTETDRRFEEARLRDQDFVRREEQIQTRQAEIDLREDELARRETAWRDREGPSVADVVTGRAEGRVSDGTAQWVDDGTTRPVGDQESDPARGAEKEQAARVHRQAHDVREHHDTRELRVDEHGRPVEDPDAHGEPVRAPRRVDDA